jgi:hypothetical protein
MIIAAINAVIWRANALTDRLAMGPCPVFRALAVERKVLVLKDLNKERTLDFKGEVIYS